MGFWKERKNDFGVISFLLTYNVHQGVFGVIDRYYVICYKHKLQNSGNGWERYRSFAMFCVIASSFRCLGCRGGGGGFGVGVGHRCVCLELALCFRMLCVFVWLIVCFGYCFDFKLLCCIHNMVRLCVNTQCVDVHVIGLGNELKIGLSPSFSFRFHYLIWRRR